MRYYSIWPKKIVIIWAELSEPWGCQWPLFRHGSLCFALLSIYTTPWYPHLLHRTRVFLERWALDFVRVRSRTDPARTATRACARHVLRSPTRVAPRCMVWSASAPTSCRCMHGVLWCGRPDQGHPLPSITSPAAWTYACITICSGREVWLRKKAK